MTANVSGLLMQFAKLCLLVSVAISSTVQATQAMLGIEAGELLLVEPEWLNNHIANSDLIILDVRQATSYKKKHIKNAINIPVTKTFRSTNPTDRVASIQSIQGLFGGAGIDSSSNVIIYDDGQYINAARMFWVLEVYGHRRVAILNYGFPGWILKKLPLTDTVHRLPAKKFYAEVQPNRLTTKLHARLAISDNYTIIIDSRVHEEFLGLKSSTSRVGHIPTAINIPWNKNFTQNNDILVIQDRVRLEHIYRDVDRNKRVITYCNRGKQSALTYFVLRILGRDVSHYDGSWIEWSEDHSLPVETVDKRAHVEIWK